MSETCEGILLCTKSADFHDFWWFLVMSLNFPHFPKISAQSWNCLWEHRKIFRGIHRISKFLWALIDTQTWLCEVSGAFGAFPPHEDFASSQPLVNPLTWGWERICSRNARKPLKIGTDQDYKYTNSLPKSKTWCRLSFGWRSFWSWYWIWIAYFDFPGSRISQQLVTSRKTLFKWFLQSPPESFLLGFPKS